MKTRTFKIVTAILFLAFMLGCDSNLEEKPPHLITSETLYTSLAGFETGLNGAYSLIRAEHNGSIDFTSSMFTCGTDNLCANWRQGFGVIGTFWGDLNGPSNTYFKNVFAWLYSIVNATNTMINQAEKRSNINWTGTGSSADDNKNRVIAEAKAIRAWAYRHLTFCWGDVPLNLEESLGSTIKTDWDRTPVADVRKQIISDLSFAEKYIPVEPVMAGRLTKGAVQHYLSEMYLTVGKADSALYWANKVINTPNYKLITARYGVKKSQPGVAFMDMFYQGNKNREEGNTEALWVWQFEFETIGGGSDPCTRAHHQGRFMDIKIGGVVPLQITYERGGRGKAYTAPTKFAIDLYEKQDDRGSNYAMRKYFILKDAAGNAPYPADKLPPTYHYGDTIWLRWTNDLTPATWQRTDWPYSRKVEGTNPDNVTQSPNFDDYIALRLADTYLLKAEAQFKLGLLADAAATINVIRNRSHASLVTSANINLDFILDERSRELFLEEQRRYTLLRTGKWYERTKAHNHFGGENITLKDTLFPIPQSVIDANITKPMTQNPGFN
ncbi:MAG TPA: RagB/SusD family nutrient uptake outer membrane protein [Lentimicrobium sp.]|nr:RagB/SusD family nutrient uptake outer membrane protein [Lentimicrobium sp.]